MQRDKTILDFVCVLMHRRHQCHIRPSECHSLCRFRSHVKHRTVAIQLIGTTTRAKLIGSVRPNAQADSSSKREK